MRRTFSCVMAIAVGLSARSSVNAAPLRLTMEEAVARATATSAELKAGMAGVRAAEANREHQDAWLPANPYVSGGVQPNIESQFGPTYALSISQEFEIGGQRSQRAAVAQHGLERERREAVQARRNLVASVKKAFVGALGASERVTLTRSELDAAKSFARELAAKGAGTDAARIDLNVAEIQVSRATRDLAVATEGAEDALDTLRYYVGLPAGREIDLVGVLETEVRPLPPRSEMIEKALKQRADLAALRAHAAETERQVDLARRQRIPNVTLTGSVSRFEGDTFAGGELGLFLPLVDRGGASIKEAISERDRARWDLRDTQRIIVWEVAQAHRGCVTAGTALRIIGHEVLPKSLANLRIEQRLFERGEVAVVGLIGVQIDALTARREHLDAAVNYSQALIELERVTGVPAQSM